MLLLVVFCPCQSVFVPFEAMAKALVALLLLSLVSVASAAVYQPLQPPASGQHRHHNLRGAAAFVASAWRVPQDVEWRDERRETGWVCDFELNEAGDALKLRPRGTGWGRVMAVALDDGEAGDKLLQRFPELARVPLEPGSWALATVDATTGETDALLLLVAESHAMSAVVGVPDRLHRDEVVAVTDMTVGILVQPDANDRVREAAAVVAFRRAAPAT